MEGEKDVDFGREFVVNEFRLGRLWSNIKVNEDLKVDQIQKEVE